MNITCEKCQKRYSIADDRVRGKSVKIRCRHCQNLMVIHGSGAEERTAAMPALDMARLKAQAAKAPAAWEEEPTRAAPTLDPSIVWFAMVKGKQHGPFDMRALHTKVKAGEISLRTYVWHQGMADWKRARDVSELGTLFSGHGASTAVVSGPAAAPAPETAPAPAPVAIAAARAEPAKPRRTRSGTAVPIEAKPAPAPAKPEPVKEGALSSVQAPAKEIVGEKANGHDPLGELFTDSPAAEGDGPVFETTVPAPADTTKLNGKVAEDDPFAALGDIDPAQLPPPGEATRFFIEQAGVNKRNPPWKIAAFLLVGIAAPVSLLYALSVMRIVPLEVTRVDDQGREVKESLFSTGGVSGLGDLLTGKNKAKKPPPKPDAPKPVVAIKKPAAAVEVEPVREVKPPPVNPPTPEELAALYSDAQKTDKGPKVRQDTELKPKDSSTGGLAEEAVAKVVAQYQPAFQQCIEAELRKNPGFRGGKIDITAIVGSSGVVKKAEIDRKDIDLSDLGGCLKGRAKRMSFPSFAGDEETEVHIPLILTATM